MATFSFQDPVPVRSADGAGGPDRDVRVRGGRPPLRRGHHQVGPAPPEAHPLEQPEGRLRRPREEGLHAQDPLRQQERRWRGRLLGRKRGQVNAQ